MTAKVKKIRGEDVKAGQIIILEDKRAYCVLQNDRGKGGNGALKLHRPDWQWRGYEHWNTFDVITKVFRGEKNNNV